MSNSFGHVCAGFGWDRVPFLGRRLYGAARISAETVLVTHCNALAALAALAGAYTAPARGHRQVGWRCSEG